MVRVIVLVSPFVSFDEKTSARAAGCPSGCDEAALATVRLFG
jgi:hypothetical protein